MRLNIALFILSGLILNSGPNINAQTISPTYFAQNAWMPDTIGVASSCPAPPCVLYGKLHQLWGAIRNSSPGIVRFGGMAADRNMPTNYQYIKMIDSIRATGIEPIIQVPFHKYDYSPQQAAAIVNYINIVKGRNIKYWSIGNEPDLEYAYTSASQVAPYIKSFSSAMKAVDPSILILGPECAWYNQNIINGLTTPGGPYDITGRDAAGRLYVDVITFHTYPFGGTQTRDLVISKLTSPGGFRDNLQTLGSRIAACNIYHNRTGPSLLKMAVTEANINYQNSSNDNLIGLGVNSFIGGQFIAEMFGIGLQQGLSFLNIWSVCEGNNTALNIGYIDPAQFVKKPAYHHFKLLADNLRGTYLNCVSTHTNVKSFGSTGSQSICVMVMNQDQTGNFNFTIRLNNSPVTGNDPVRINVASTLAVQYSDVINNQSTAMLFFNGNGQLVKKITYSLAGNALNNLPPTVQSFGVLPVELTGFSGIYEDGKMLLRWGTASEKNNKEFAVQRSQDAINFADIGIVGGSGNSSVYRSYNYTDLAPLYGTSYYRLKQTDFDGNFSHSEIIAVERPQRSDVVIFPSPSDGTELWISSENQISYKDLNVFDMKGNQVRYRLSEAKNGVYVLNFTPPLRPGLYLLVIGNENSVVRKRFIVY